jgi:hypothetical protein
MHQRLTHALPDRRTLAATVAAALLALVLPPAPRAEAQACNPDAGSCIQTHPTPGCENEDCCTTVCDADPTCCSVAWDADCVALAEERCEGLCGADASGDCRLPHPNPGCDDEACCELVCGADPTCCETTWDTTCTFIAEALCPGGPPVECGLPNQGPCLQVHATPGCDNASCCTAVCNVDPSCCSVSWDNFCVQLAITSCFGCIYNCPPESVAEQEPCGVRSNDPCAAGESAAVFPASGLVCGTFDTALEGTAWTGDRDGWAVNVTDPDGDGVAKVTLRLAVGPRAFVALVPRTCPVNLMTAPLKVQGGNCTEAAASACLPPGQYWVMFSPGTYPNPGSDGQLPCNVSPRYSLRVEVSQIGCAPACTTATGPCFDEHEGVGCVNSACCGPACAADPFCCNQRWDVDCARLAAAACGIPVPANDTCATPTALGVGQTIEFTTIRASSEGLPLPSSCVGNTGPVMGPDVWFSYNGERRGTIVVDTCGSATDLRMVVYKGTCENLQLVGCSSTSVLCSPNTRPRVQFVANCGERYLIRVGGENEAIAGSARITLSATGPVCPEFCPADLNRDTAVNGDDLGILLGRWGAFGGTGDLNGNGVVNGDDLGILLGAWGACPPPPQ